MGEEPPYLNLLILPIAERRGAAEQMYTGLGELWSAVRTFKHALNLFEFCVTEKPEESEWKLIAARDGAWSISNLGFAIQHFRGTIGAHPTLKSLIVHEELRVAQKMYEAWFPNFPNIRHSLAHGPEVTKDQIARNKHYYQGPFRSDGEIIEGDQTKMIVKHSLRENVYQTTFEGHLLCYEVSSITLEKLVQVKDRFFLGFRSVEAKSLSTKHFVE